MSAFADTLAFFRIAAEAGTYPDGDASTTQPWDIGWFYRAARPCKGALMSAFADTLAFFRIAAEAGTYPDGDASTTQPWDIGWFYRDPLAGNGADPASGRNLNALCRAYLSDDGARARLAFGEADDGEVDAGMLEGRFSLNARQRLAVRRALDSDISLVQGPPGTGKTETILNMASCMLARGATVAVVSTNRDALANITKKVAGYAGASPHPQHGLVHARPRRHRGRGVHQSRRARQHHQEGGRIRRRLPGKGAQAASPVRLLRPLGQRADALRVERGPSGRGTVPRRRRRRRPPQRPTGHGRVGARPDRREVPLAPALHNEHHPLPQEVLRRRGHPSIRLRDHGRGVPMRARARPHRHEQRPPSRAGG